MEKENKTSRASQSGQRRSGRIVADSDSQRPQGQRTNGSAEGREVTERQAGLRGGTVLADSKGIDGQWSVRQGDRSGGSEAASGDGGKTLADSDIDDGRRGCGAKSSGRESRMEHWSGGECGRSEEWWEVEPDVGRLVDGLPNRVPQLRALGNSIVPQIAQKIGQAIKETYYA